MQTCCLWLMTVLSYQWNDRNLKTSLFKTPVCQQTKQDLCIWPFSEAHFHTYRHALTHTHTHRLAGSHSVSPSNSVHQIAPGGTNKHQLCVLLSEGQYKDSTGRAVTHLDEEVYSCDSISLVIHAALALKVFLFGRLQAYVRGYRTKQRMSCFSALPRTAPSRGHALVCDFFSTHLYSLTLCFLILCHCNTTLFLIQLDKPWKRPWCFMRVVLGSPWMAHQRLEHMFLYAFNCYSWFTIVFVYKKEQKQAAADRQRGAPCFSLRLSTSTHTHTDRLVPFTTFPASP